MTDGRVMKRFVVDNVEYAAILLKIKTVDLPQLDKFLEMLEAQDRGMSKFWEEFGSAIQAQHDAIWGTKKPKVLEINVAEELSATTKFGG